MTRPSNRLLRDNPGTVVRYLAELCKACHLGTPPRTVEMAQVDREEYDARQEKIRQERLEAAHQVAERVSQDRKRRMAERARKERVAKALQSAGVVMR